MSVSKFALIQPHPSSPFSSLSRCFSPRTAMIRTTSFLFFFLFSLLQRVTHLSPPSLPLPPPKADLGKSESLEVCSSSLTLRRSFRSVSPGARQTALSCATYFFPLTYIFTVMISIPSFPREKEKARRVQKVPFLDRTGSIAFGRGILAGRSLSLSIY